MVSPAFPERPPGRTPGRSPGRRPVRRFVAALLLIALLVLLLLAGGAFLVQSRLDQTALKARVERQGLASTGRRLTLGSLHIQLLPVPMVVADDIAFADMPDGARPAMLTAGELSAHLAMWPLVHHVARLEGVTLTAPDLLLERDADGVANWQMHPVETASSAGPAGTPEGGERWRVEIGSVRLLDGKVAWQDALRGWTGEARLDRLDGTGLAGDSPIVDLGGHHGAAGFSLRLATGALSRLTAATSKGPAWPLHLAARTQRNERQDASLTIDGTLADPLRARSFALDIALQADRPDGMNALFPKAAIPPLGPITLNTRLVDQAQADAPAAAPLLERLSLVAGGIDAGALLPRPWTRGLTIRSLSIAAPSRAAPVAIAVEGDWQGRDLAVHGTAGTLDDWHDGLDGVAKAPFDLALVAGDAQATLKGVAKAARGATQASLALKATIPSLRALVPVGPALTGLGLSATLALGPGRSLGLTGLSLDSKQLGLAGDATIVADRRPTVTARLTASHIDVDSLWAGWVSAPPPESPGPAAASSAADAANPSPAPPGAAPTDAGARTGGQAVTPVAPVPGGHEIPFAQLRRADLDIGLDAAAVTFDGDGYKSLSTRLSLKDGALSLSPFTAIGPAGPIAGQIDADAGKQAVALTLQPSMLPAATLAHWLGKPSVLDGTVELVAALQASGATSDALADDASGHAGLSMVDGSISNAALAGLIGRSGGVPDQGRTTLRCLALPATLAGGVATLDRVALSTSRLTVQGSGTIRLRDGALDLHLLPRLSIGTSGATLPVRVGGTVDGPVAALDPAAPGGRFALTIGGGAPPDPCDAALEAARFGAAGPRPGAAPDAGRHKLPKPIDILRGLGLFH